MHAHLNGSLSASTVAKLIDIKKKNGGTVNVDYLSFYNTFDDSDSLEKCFDKFKVAHDLVDSKEAVSCAVSCVIDEFAKENVIYLELRSTPRKTSLMSKRDYLEAVIGQMM